ncbi:MAG: Gfo/Idh/MocA family oxidoreductase [Kiritimatiellae bacterium]|nr:Gfo/Idh/MocA family oxidoreductase [Kiritimatiellia bacterium]
MNRRELLKNGGLCAAALIANGCKTLPPLSRGKKASPAPAAVRKPPARRLNVAVIGAGGQGLEVLKSVAEAGDRVAALCDVDRNQLESSTAMLGRRYQQRDIAVFKDFRVLLEQQTTAGKRLDAVFVATPDHGHAMQVREALRYRVPVFVEAPAVRTLGELRLLQNSAKECKTPLWQGICNRTETAFRQAVAAIEGGIIGTVNRVYVWTSAPLWPQGMAVPTDGEPPPPELDWELWQLPHTGRRYREGAYLPAVWRGWCDFGTGSLGSEGPALMNLPFQALELQPPVKIECLGERSPHPESYPAASRLRFTFKGQKKSKASDELTMEWSDAGVRPDIMETLGQGLNRIPAEGCLLAGTRGFWLMADRTGRRHYFASAGNGFVPLDQAPAVADFMPKNVAMPLRQTFLEMIRRGKNAKMSTNLGSSLLETVLTGCVAMRTGADALEWNSGRTRFLRNPEANALVGNLPG